MMHSRTPLCLLAFPVVLALGSCGVSSNWDRGLESGPDRAAPLKSEPILRTVPWERVEKTLGELHQDIANSDIHPDEWSDERKAAARAKLLRGLQVSQDPSVVRILGHSRFRTTDDLSRAHKDLSRLAKEMGADMVIWSTRVLGKSETIVDRPVTSSTWGTGWFRDTDDEHRHDTFTAHTTSWVPVRVTLDETGAVAYFLRVHP